MHPGEPAVPVRPNDQQGSAGRLFDEYLHRAASNWSRDHVDVGVLLRPAGEALARSTSSAVTAPARATMSSARSTLVGHGSSLTTQLAWCCLGAAVGHWSAWRPVATDSGWPGWSQRWESDSSSQR